MAFKLNQIVPWGRSLKEYPKFFSLTESDLVISSHFLFLYSELYSFENHLKSIVGMLRVAEEARVFPVLDLNANKSVHLMPIIDKMEKWGFNCSVEKVDYEFQVGGNEMLK